MSIWEYTPKHPSLLDRIRDFPAYVVDRITEDRSPWQSISTLWLLLTVTALVLLVLSRWFR